MKIRSNWLNRAAGWAVGTGLRPWIGSVRTAVTVEDHGSNPLREAGDCIIAVWHETILLTTPYLGRVGGSVVISKSRDGDIIAAAAAAVGWRVVRGSSSRGGAEAVRECLRDESKPGPFRLAVTLDGPRGPRRVAQAGAVFLAARTGVPITPICVACTGGRARSWDQMLLPRLFGRAAIRIGPRLHVPSVPGSRAVWLRKLQAEMDRLTALAEADLAGAAPAARHRRAA